PRRRPWRAGPALLRPTPCWTRTRSGSLRPRRSWPALRRSFRGALSWRRARRWVNPRWKRGRGWSRRGRRREGPCCPAACRPSALRVAEEGDRGAVAGVEHDEVAWRHGLEGAREELVEHLLRVLLVADRALRIVDDVQEHDAADQRADGGFSHQARSAMSTTLEPPKAKEFDITARGGATRSARSRTWRTRQAGSGCSRKAVGARTPFSRARTATANSSAPAPPSRWPCSDFVELTGTSL